MSRKLAWAALAAAVAGLFGSLFALRSEFTVPENFPVLDAAEIGPDAPPTGGTELATFGSGCFWCTEAVFQQLKGVTKVVSGYSGGSEKNPTYEQVCSGRTGHAEVIQVTFDPAVVSYPELLEVFWRSHDPTTRNRQGNDVGPQYRSVVFTHSDRQRQLAELYKQKIDAAQVFPRPLVTEIEPFTAFYPAEAYHQNYFADNPRQPYCRAIIGPKVEKLKAVFATKLKADAP
ncbi:peptide methionine sulfoxide reductase : Peptide methionine sulfoxide reductase MsrA OS=Cytophaga hutchinsonii (strain ATCC 33406 / NCIMB 9469) GN=msrA PE=3 SV=1: PMSR [Gemmataceae bacterium]|nr:peptide methionine sulfoxide reductase : Peptide methionine sulfoxide reductase MsrA OS=Cytophaga hutchinsonii (strain ATCC 33406 / NCIMB 9469) GN=msrA PE=3 SV=1: PMSR [Gemmataceae bacterium]VTU00072.1 peptide methionine sulfoxide reductase : Peptide methionine sulfoxide reductase MsrA OS=Cytophaga hutchinsonii (strain ATCC 33406 / NCIMB 9469) GN=msrA PE=3 SV=1: PMSR [Gemmataceae bacterium]